MGMGKTVLFVGSQQNWCLLCSISLWSAQSVSFIPARDISFYWFYCPFFCSSCKRLPKSDAANTDNPFCQPTIEANAVFLFPPVACGRFVLKKTQHRKQIPSNIPQMFNISLKTHQTCQSFKMLFGVWE